MDDKLCALCLERPREVRFGCGHATSCTWCTLRIIQHSSHQLLKCPTCTATVDMVYTVQGESGSRIARQPTFLKIESPQTVRAARVQEFIDVQLQSTDEKYRELAEAANKAWMSSSQFPGAYVPLRPVQSTRYLTLIVSFCLLVSYTWGIVAVARAKSEFEKYVMSSVFDARVTRLQWLDGPVMALVPQGRLCDDVPCTDQLDVPTAHQRWWALIPSSLVGTTQNTSSTLITVRLLIALMTSVTTMVSVLKPLISSIANDPRALSELSSAGLNSMVGMAVLCSLYGMIYDKETGLVMVNYVPGWGYLWTLVWMFIFFALIIVFSIKKKFFILYAAVVSFFYWLFWLFIPLIG